MESTNLLRLRFTVPGQHNERGYQVMSEEQGRERAVALAAHHRMPVALFRLFEIGQDGRTVRRVF